MEDTARVVEQGEQLFYGNALNSVDSKNRVSVPAQFRAVIKGRTGGEEFLIREHEDLPCLVAYDHTYLKELRDEAEARLAQDPSANREDVRRSLFGAADSVKFDDAGRIVLDGFFIDYASIEKTALFLGAQGYFEVWNPYTFLETQAHQKALCRKVMYLLKQKKLPLPEGEA